MQYQRGALSLFWCVVLIGLLATAAMAALFSMRHERNLFAEGWSRLIGMPVAQTLQQTQSAVTQAAQPKTAELRKCMVKGVVTYSNVECGADNATSRKVEIQDTRGIEAPKAAPAAPPHATMPANATEKMIERAVQGR